jgi:hypothetical protein
MLALEYRGYGLSPGESAEGSLNDDIANVWQYATGTMGVDPSRVVLWGCSLGTHHTH